MPKMIYTKEILSKKEGLRQDEQDGAGARFRVPHEAQSDTTKKSIKTGRKEGQELMLSELKAEVNGCCVKSR